MADEEHHADQVEDPHEDAEGADELKHCCRNSMHSNQSAGYCGYDVVRLSCFPMLLISLKIGSGQKKSLNPTAQQVDRELVRYTVQQTNMRLVWAAFDWREAQPQSRFFRISS